MAKNKNSEFETYYTAFILLIFFALLATFALSYTAKDLISNEIFFTVYTALGVVGFIFACVATWYNIFDKGRSNQAENEISSAIFLADEGEERVLSDGWLRLITIVAITLFFTIAVVSTGKSFVDPPNPFSAEGLSKSVLDEHSFWVNVWAIGLIPGLFEEMVIFGLVCVLNGGILIGLGKLLGDDEMHNNTVAILIVSIFTVAIGAFVFTTAHGAAYGADDDAFKAAFFFEYVVQYANQLTGLFISWIPHMAHNIAVVITTQTAFSIGGTFALFMLPITPQIYATLKAKLMLARRRLETDWMKLRKVTLS